MRWEKLGHVFVPEPGATSWMCSHAANPFALPLADGIIKVFFNSRDRQNRAHVGSLEMRLGPSPEVLRVHADPVLAPGDNGFFDDSGVSLGCIVRDRGRTLMYYVGWNLAVTVPWRNSIGLATGEVAGNNFEKYGLAPIVDRNDVDPFSLSYPAVVTDGNVWRMYYGSNLDWGDESVNMHHVIKYAESDDGRQWRRDGTIAVGLEREGEYALSRPSVLKREGIYHMWYSHRGDAYRIGYAVSRDGLRWERRDDIGGLDASPDGWDSEMVCYPNVFEFEGEWYMLYNGNGFGRSGFGLARRVE